MLKFYWDSFAAFLLMLVVTGAIVYGGFAQSKLNHYLFPAQENGLLWMSAIEPKQPEGETRLTLKNEVGTVEYDFFLDGSKKFPYSHYSIYFVDPIQSFQQVDLTRYREVSFNIICDPKNVLMFVLFSYDDKVTKLNDMASRRVSSAAFSCTSHWERVTVKFDELVTPDWWLGRFGYEFSERGYQLDKTMGFAWVNSLQSPLETPSNVKLTDVRLQGSDPRFIYGSVIVSLCIWGLFGAWLLRRYVAVLTLELHDKIKQDLPLIAYKKLSIQPQKDKEKSALLRFMATEYANADLSLETAVASLGMNRTKVNEILKEELGLTFTSYLNKLRLTEAARLLSESAEANVSEIAYSVGYNNVSYFNKLFKSEYGCAPKTFKLLCRAKENE